MAWTSGGPLLSVEDLLQDLKEQQPGAPDFPWFDQPNRSVPELEEAAGSVNVELNDIFQRTYDQLSTALEKPGYGWLASTQKLCSGLAMADQVVRDSESKFGKVLEMLKDFRNMVHKKQACISLLKGEPENPKGPS